MKKNFIETITKHIIDLPALPSVVSKLIGLVDDPKVSSHDIAKLISSDQAITAKLLRLSNSSYYTFQKEIKTVPFAVSLMGFDTVVNLALSLSVVGRFTTSAVDDNFELMEFWEHSLSVAVVAKRIAEDIMPDAAAEVFTMGILHDIGKLIIHEYLHKEYLEIEKLIIEKDYLSLEAETKILEINHSIVGEFLCKQWKLPVDIINCVRFHHYPDQDKSGQKFSSIIHLADLLCNLLEVQHPQVEHNKNELNLSILDKLKLKQIVPDELDFDFYLEQTKIEIEKAEEFISLLKNG